MFCEKCGTRVDDGQPFCPNCGTRLGAQPAPAAPARPAPRPASALGGGLLANLNGMTTLKKIFVLALLGLLILGLVMSWLKVLGHVDSERVADLKAELAKAKRSDYYSSSELKELEEEMEEALDAAHMHFYLHEAHGSWLLILTSMLSPLAIAIVVLYILGKIDNPIYLLIVAGIAATIWLLLLIKWIAGYTEVYEYRSKEVSTHITVHLSFAGWLMFLSEMGAAALAALTFFFDKKKA